MWTPTITGRSTRTSTHSSKSSFTGLSEKTTSKGRGRAPPLPSFSSPIFYPEHELPKEAFVADWLRQMHAERMSYGAGYTEIMTGRLNLFMMRLNTSFLTQELEIEAKEIVLEMRAYVASSEHLRSEAAAPPWLESLHEILHENCCDPIHVSDQANEAGGRPASRPSNPLSCSDRIS